MEKLYELIENFIEKLEEFKNQFKFSDENKIFKAELTFKGKEFENATKNLLDYRKIPNFEKENDIIITNFANSKNYAEDLFKIINNVLNGNLSLKSKINKRDAIISLLNPYHFIRFNIIDENDTLEKMSPGKRSFALLKVLIKLDDSKWPILLDQPEDDLDANSISNDLSKFLRDTKKERQIIIVSHNPNLVIGADSEQIIVANQHGNDAKNKSKRFEFVSGSIENTCTDENEDYLDSKGIKEHVCYILEGGEESFKKRQSKYNIE
ncbi:AAA family ATPase [Methanobrevibacter arboriphilus]|uniref:AAA family ATPase n=1 Tax=Methanobrevibacter arboriphilus TaxID=39441 RepID=UPI0005B25452|nr:ATP-binding protein [Methanobrevibacter arboriphilus]